MHLAWCAHASLLAALLGSETCYNAFRDQGGQVAAGMEERRLRVCIHFMFPQTTDPSFADLLPEPSTLRFCATDSVFLGDRGASSPALIWSPSLIICLGIVFVPHETRRTVLICSR